MNKRPVLERLKLAGSGKTYLRAPDMEFYTLMKDAINRIEELEEYTESLEDCNWDKRR